MKIFGANWLRILIVFEFLLIVMLFVPGASLTTWLSPAISSYAQNPNPETKNALKIADKRFHDRLKNWKILWGTFLIANTTGIALIAVFKQIGYKDKAC
jgi:hypothetical protein